MMNGFKSSSSAKLKHVQACLSKESQYRKSAGFEEITLNHEAASGLALSDVSLATQFLGHKLKAPLMIAPMTGGMELGAVLNERWAKAAEFFGLCMGVGSQRLAIEDPSARASFSIRKYAPSALIFANLGAGQLVQGMNAKHALQAVSMIKANALFIHLNPVQEACKPYGDVSFSHLLKTIAAVVEILHREQIPVLVREVGFGLSKESAKRLISTGVAGLDCSGAGGTSWAKVEAMCAQEEKYRRLGRIFGEWGIPTVQSIKNVRSVDKAIPLIASGGLRSGLDLAKSLALGADLGAMAQPMLEHAMLGEEALFAFIEQCFLELRIALYASGVQEVKKLTYF